MNQAATLLFGNDSNYAPRNGTSFFYIASAPWLGNDDRGNFLFTLPVCPGQMIQVAGEGQVSTPIAADCLSYSFWSGSIDFRFSITAPTTSIGKLYVAHTTEDAHELVLNQLMLLPKVVMNIPNDNTATISVKYSRPDSVVELNDAEETVVVFVADQFRDPHLIHPVRLYVEARLGEDFRFHRTTRG